MIMARGNEHVIIEFIRMGRYVKVSAVDAVTHEEVSLIGDARHTKDYLAQLAVKKLRHVQKKR
jgi:hypothetical protein